MSQELKKLIARDTAFCSAMTDEMGDYIKSDVLYWESGRRQLRGVGLPKLTFGGLLLAMRRLATLHDHVDPDQAATLTRAERELDLQKSQWRSRYQDKLARELRSRLDAWAWYLDDCRAQGESAIVHYPRQVETRTKADLLLDEAGKVGLDVKESHQRQLALDERLGAFFTVGEFCWLEELAPGFPPDRFWYLWGQPTNDRPL
jgi:hypothetical protein